MCVIIHTYMCKITHQGVWITHLFKKHIYTITHPKMCCKTHQGVLQNTPRCVTKHTKVCYITQLKLCQNLDKWKTQLKVCFLHTLRCVVYFNTPYFRVQWYAIVHSIVIIICIYYIIFEIQTFLLLVHGGLLSYAACMLIRVLVVEQVHFLPQCVAIKESSKLFLFFHDQNGPVKTSPEKE